MSKLTFIFPPGATVTLTGPGSPVVDAVTDLIERAALAQLAVQRQGGLGRPRWIVPCTAQKAMQLKLVAFDLFAADPPVFAS